MVIVVIVWRYISHACMVYRDGQVFASSGMSLYKLQLQVKEAIRKLQEGVEFGTRGVRLMGSDVGGAARMFWRAALGTATVHVISQR